MAPLIGCTSCNQEEICEATEKDVTAMTQAFEKAHSSCEGRRVAYHDCSRCKERVWWLGHSGAGRGLLAAIKAHASRCKSS